MGGDPSLIEAIVAWTLAAVLQPFAQVLFQTSLIWWPFLATALALAMVVYCWRSGRGISALDEFRQRFLSRAIWLHDSARADYAFYIANGILYPVVVGPLVIGGAVIGAGIDATLTKLYGPMTAPLLDRTFATGLYTIAFFIAYDFGRFAAHSLLHDVPALWNFHRVHHSAEVLTPFTNYRVHPVDLFIMAVVPNATTGVVTGLVWYLSGEHIGFYTFFGLHVGIALFNMFGNLRHWQVWISFGPVLNRWLISPAHHQIHHSREARHIGKNRGFELAIWDRLWGTLYAPVEEERFALGLGDGTDGEWHIVSRLYGWPLRDMWTRLCATATRRVRPLRTRY